MLSKTMKIAMETIMTDNHDAATFRKLALVLRGAIERLHER